MKYRLHDGIVYTKICNVHVLVATRSVWDLFPAVREVSPLQGCFCKGIEQGMDEDELIQAINLPATMDREAVRERYHIFARKMTEEGYLVPEEETCSV